MYTERVTEVVHVLRDQGNYEPGVYTERVMEAGSPHIIIIIIVTRPPTVPDQYLNPGPLSLEANALLTELIRPDNVTMNMNMTSHQKMKLKV